MLTYNQWRATCRELSLAEACEELGMHRQDFGGTAKTVYLFDDLSYVEQWSTGSCWTVVERSEWHGSFDDVSQALYFTHYVQNHIGGNHVGLDTLSDLLQDFYRWQRFPRRCAEEMLATIGEARFIGLSDAREWLSWFSRTWDETVDLVPCSGKSWYIVVPDIGRWVAEEVTLIRRKAGDLWLVEHADGVRSWRDIDLDLGDKDTAEREADGFNSRG